MSELDFRPREADVTEPAEDTAKEQGAAPNNQQGTPRAEKSILRRIADSRAARPIAALLGLSIAGGGVAAAVNSGSEGSKKAPDAIVTPSTTVPLTPDQVVAQVNQGARAEAAVAALQEAQKPEMSESEKRQRITEILQAYYPEMLQFVTEDGPLPYYATGVDKHTGKPFETVSFVTKSEPGLVSDINPALGKAGSEHFDVLAFQGLSLDYFPRKEGSTEADPVVSKQNQDAVNGVKRTVAVIVPERMNVDGVEVDTPWPWKEDPWKKGYPMFTAETPWPFADPQVGAVNLMWHPDQVENTDISPLGHHPKGIELGSGGGGGN